MWVFPTFHNDRLETIMSIQHEMYYIVADLCKRLIAAKFKSITASLYLSAEDLETRQRAIAADHDHRLFQEFHDALAAVFRHKVQYKQYGVDLFSQPSHESIIRFFTSADCPVEFLARIEQYYFIEHDGRPMTDSELNYAVVWYRFVTDTLQNNRRFNPALRSLVECWVHNSKFIESNYRDGVQRCGQLHYAYRARKQVKALYPSIPWSIPEKKEEKPLTQTAIKALPHHQKITMAQEIVDEVGWHGLPTRSVLRAAARDVDETGKAMAAIRALIYDMRGSYRFSMTERLFQNLGR